MLKRHELAWLTAPGWAALRAAGAPAPDAVLARWQEAGWPLVARRRDADAGGDEVCLGLALPPDEQGNKLRFPLRVPRAAVARRAPPLALKAVAATLPAAWSGPAAELIEESLGLGLRVYGSVAWQTLTGLPYLSEASDLDLLLEPHNEHQLRAGLALLQKYAAVLPLDGEIMFPRGAGVAWKEWVAAAASDARVLVKDEDTARLAARTLLAASLGSAA